jgi:cytochrome P450/NADPH-cytochrome P450 reductase
MRGFLQERPIKAARNAQVGPAILYFGFPHHKKVYICLGADKVEHEGVVSVRPYFSKVEPDGCFKYVPDRL